MERVHRQAHREWARGARHGVTPAEYEYLRAIAAQERRKTDIEDHGQHLHDVVAQMGVSKASASAMVLKLEAADLVRRMPCRMDARAQHIFLTETGRAKLETGEGVFEAVAAAVLAELDDDDRQSLATLLMPPSDPG
ncbi:MAG: MarR family transcriptional regulator [Novosphingobium sp.]